MCELTSGFSVINCDSPGGVDTIYLGSLRDATTRAANYTFTRTNGAITAMANVGSKLFYEITVDAEMSDFTVTAIGSRENASAAFEISGSFKLAGVTDTDIQKLDSLTRDRVCVIAKMNDGTLEVLGITNGCKFAFTRTSGMKFDDFNGVTLTFTGRESLNPPKISDAIVTTLLS
jgi:hypothetical protein